MEVVIWKAHRDVLAFACSRSHLLLRDCHSLRKSSPSRIVRFHGAVDFQDQTDNRSDPLTLANLESRVESGKKGKIVKHGNLKTSLKVSPMKAKPVRNNVSKVEVKNAIFPFDGAPFTAKTFSELGLSALLIDRLDKEGLTAPTDVPPFVCIIQH